MGASDDLWDRIEVARRTGLSVSTISTYTTRSRQRLRREGSLRPGDFPIPVRVDGRVRWMVEDVQEYLRHRAPHQRPEQWVATVATHLREGDVIDMPGEGMRWVQVVRPANDRGLIQVRIGARRDARTGQWRALRAKAMVMRLVQQ